MLYSSDKEFRVCGVKIYSPIGLPSPPNHCIVLQYRLCCDIDVCSMQVAPLDSRPTSVVLIHTLLDRQCRDPSLQLEFRSVTGYRCIDLVNAENTD